MKILGKKKFFLKLSANILRIEFINICCALKIVLSAILSSRHNAIENLFPNLLLIRASTILLLFAGQYNYEPTLKHSSYIFIS